MGTPVRWACLVLAAVTSIIHAGGFWICKISCEFELPGNNATASASECENAPAVDSWSAWMRNYIRVVVSGSSARVCGRMSLDASLDEEMSSAPVALRKASARWMSSDVLQ
jgi:hypothetical protein